MNAAALIRELADAGVTLTANGDLLHVEAPSGVVTEYFRRRLIEHKNELLTALRMEAANHSQDLPGVVRARFTAACRRLGLDAGPVLRQFDEWRYPLHDLLEMHRWPDGTIEAHVGVLQYELQRGMKP